MYNSAPEEEAPSNDAFHALKVGVTMNVKQPLEQEDIFIKQLVVICDNSGSMDDVFSATKRAMKEGVAGYYENGFTAGTTFVWLFNSDDIDIETDQCGTKEEILAKIEVGFLECLSFIHLSLFLVFFLSLSLSLSLCACVSPLSRFLCVCLGSAFSLFWKTYTWRLCTIFPHMSYTTLLTTCYCSPRHQFDFLPSQPDTLGLG